MVEKVARNNYDGPIIIILCTRSLRVSSLKGKYDYVISHHHAKSITYEGIESTSVILIKVHVI